jgi:hypothetical protein
MPTAIATLSRCRRKLSTPPILAKQRLQQRARRHSDAVTATTPHLPDQAANGQAFSWPVEPPWDSLPVGPWTTSLIVARPVKRSELGPPTTGTVKAHDVGGRIAPLCRTRDYYTTRQEEKEGSRTRLTTQGLRRHQGQRLECDIVKSYVHLLEK